MFFNKNTVSTELVLDRMSFTEGDKVTGTVLVKVTKQTDIGEIFIKLGGISECIVKPVHRLDRDSPMMPVQDRKAVHVLVDKEARLMPLVESKKNFSLTPGEHKFPFSLPFPEKPLCVLQHVADPKRSTHTFGLLREKKLADVRLPPSFESPSASIFYYVKASVQRGSKSLCQSLKKVSYQVKESGIPNSQFKVTKSMDVLRMKFDTQDIRLSEIQGRLWTELRYDVRHSKVQLWRDNFLDQFSLYLCADGQIPSMDITSISVDLEETKIVQAQGKQNVTNSVVNLCQANLKCATLFNQTSGHYEMDLREYLPRSTEISDILMDLQNVDCCNLKREFRLLITCVVGGRSIKVYSGAIIPDKDSFQFHHENLPVYTEKNIEDAPCYSEVLV